MTQDELNEVLRRHKLWLSHKKGGKRANLRDADLRYAYLQGANLRDADLQGANLRDADLQGANLQHADLQRANLQHADLQGADLDYSCFPLWCGGTRFTADKKLVQQVLAHLCSLVVDDETKAELDKIRDFAKQSHRANDCGILEEDK